MRKRSKKTARNGKAGKTDLKFLFELFPRKNGKIWNDENFLKLVNGLKAGKTPKQIASQIGCKESGVLNVIGELKRAAAKGLTLENYLRAGRPCVYGKKVLVK